MTRRTCTTEGLDWVSGGNYTANKLAGRFRVLTGRSISLQATVAERPGAATAATLNSAEKLLLNRTVNGEVVGYLPTALKLADEVVVAKIGFVWAGWWVVLPSSAYQDREVVYPFRISAQ